VAVKVALRNPDREVDVAGDRLVREVLADLTIDPDTVLVIRDGELITRHEHVDDCDRLEVRPVISGGDR
jgi:sulfur carrier protein